MSMSRGLPTCRARRAAIALTVAALAIAGTALTVHGAYIQAKAVTAQLLMRAAWTRAGREARDVINRRVGPSPEIRPWPWADTWPVARLRVPALAVDQIVLADAGGESMAFGPSHVAASAPPATPGITVIGGHRDTHFSWLRDLHPGDIVDLESVEGRRVSYRVIERRVVAPDNVRFEAADSSGALVLVSCHHDPDRPGADLRDVVIALAQGRGRHAAGVDWTEVRAY